MPQFRYRAVTHAGEIVVGEVDSSSREEVVRRIEYLGHLTIDAEIAATGILDRGRRSIGKLPRSRDVSIFLRQLSLDGEQRLLVGDGVDAVAVPRDVVLDVLGIDALWSGRQAVMRFHPDGASTGAVLKLSREKAEYEIHVNWYTGGVAIAP